VIHEGGRLLYEEFPDPDPGDGELVVELRAAAVNRRHLLVRNPPEHFGKLVLAVR
jgi:NADPH:quinone reductase-like Zn-dependent oxidoreductase